MRTDKDSSLLKVRNDWADNQQVPPSSATPQKFGTLLTDNSNGSLEVRESGIIVGDHSVAIRDGDIECTRCDIRYEIPDILSLSSSFREAVYRLYLLGKIVNEDCDPVSSLLDGTDGIGTGTTDINPVGGRVNVYWADTTTTGAFPDDDNVLVGDEHNGYRYLGGGEWENSAGDVIVVDRS